MCFFNFGTLLLRRLIARTVSEKDGVSSFLCSSACSSLFSGRLYSSSSVFCFEQSGAGGGGRECVAGSIYPTWRCRSLFLQCFSGFSSFGFQLHMLNHLLASHSAWGSVLVSFVFVTFLLVLRLGNSHYPTDTRVRPLRGLRCRALSLAAASCSRCTRRGPGIPEGSGELALRVAPAVTALQAAAFSVTLSRPRHGSRSSAPG